eukprot:1841615-Rhodomonas_salina.1
MASVVTAQMLHSSSMLGFSTARPLCSIPASHYLTESGAWFAYAKVQVTCADCELDPPNDDVISPTPPDALELLG